MTPGPSRARALSAWFVPLAWALAALVGLATLASGPGISREEAAALDAARGGPTAVSGTATAGAGAPGTQPGAAARPLPAAAHPPLPALLVRAGVAAAVRLGLPHLVGARLGSALFGALLLALLSALAIELAGPFAGVLAPALLLSAPRLLLPFLQAGGRVPGAALALAALLAYRRAASAPRPRVRLVFALGSGVLLGLALSFQLEAAQLLAVAAAHAALVPGLAAIRRRLSAAAPAAEEIAHHPGSALLAVASMALLGPAIAFAAWPWLWADPPRRLLQAAAGVAGSLPLAHLGRVLEGARPPLGYPLLVTALALPVVLLLAFGGGLLHALARLRWERPGGPALPGELLLLLAAAAPLAAAQLGLAARAPGPGPWLAAFPVLAALGARAVLACATALWRRRAGWLAAPVALAVLAPGVAASLRAFPDLGASWGELAGGVTGAASLGLARHDGEPTGRLLAEVSARARPGARVLWVSAPPAALAMYAADARIRPDLSAVATAGEADLAVVPVEGGSRREEYLIWTALQTTAPVAGLYLDEVPLALIYARPGAWR